MRKLHKHDPEIISRIQHNMRSVIDFINRHENKQKNTMNLPNANRTMDLLPKSIEKKIPPLYAQENKGNETIVYLKLFLPCGDWTWFITEYDPKEKIAFGKTFSNMCPDGELGYISLTELAELLHNKVAIERDKFFKPTKLIHCTNPCT